MRVYLSLVALAFAAAQGPGGRSDQRGNVWIDPNREEPGGTNYRLFSTPARGADTQASYLVYLPPSYETSGAKRYPVLYWLHGGGGSQREGGWMVEKIDQQIRAGKLPPFIVILVQGLPDVRYVNSKDGTRPVEDVIVRNLIPHVDSTYRTIAARNGRAVEGMSMGGFGALRLGFQYPDLFGAVSALAPSIKEMKDEPTIVTEPFGNDQDYFDAVGPWNTVKEHAEAIRGRTTIRLLVGDRDVLLPYVEKYSQLLKSLHIQHQYVIAPGASHRYDEIIERCPFDALAFWGNVFSAKP